MLQAPISWREVFSDLLNLSEKVYVPELADDFDEDFRCGLVHGLFIKRDQRLVGRVFESLSSSLHIADFQDQILALYRRRLKREVTNIQAEIKKTDSNDKIKFEVIRDCERRILTASWEHFTRECMSFYDAFFSANHAPVAKDNFFKDNYVLFKIAELLFEHLVRSDRDRFVIPKDSLLAHEYANAGVDLFALDAQFSSYGLLTVVDELKFSTTKPLEPFDARVGKYVTLDSVASTVLDLVELKDAGAIGTLSFRPRLNAGLRSNNTLNIAMEELERGALFDLTNLDKPDITKLYSESYDTLWVKIDVGDITFEEMVCDFVVEGDYIVTQVVHLQHSKKGGEYLINHIDHEFIYYTVDEYEARKSIPSQKGEGRGRIKTFKVDDAAIPFTLSDGRWFLYSILERHFQNTDLIQEYFRKVI